MMHMHTATNPQTLTHYEQQLTTAREQLEQIEDQIAQIAHEAHEAGLKWSEIGEALGITRQSASARYRHPRILRSAP